ncbi:beta-N-acetylhexosaminidase [Parasedimentitalea maritima]|uniref:beta-N-acetylhexosaminidase n=1 Tax=Parasedimentitalea maritima TaxID=2578117 RepID=A0A6A4REV0_9RHOB|nr:beta-N-acetylhexosaminidase [Zongyanglinia marina]KAE9627188.1 family 20 glycosylhydrolase [Zongyanglinia marina]
MHAFHFDTLWHDSGAMEMVVTNLSDDTVVAPRLYYGSITRTLMPSKAEGGRFVRRQANYHEYAADETMALAPGAQWHVTEHSLTRAAVHSNEGPKSGAILLSSGERGKTFVADLQAAAPQRNEASEASDLRCGVLPQAQSILVENYHAQTPPHLLVRGDLNLQREASKVSALTRRLHPLVPVPFVLAAPQGTIEVSAKLSDQRDDSYAIRFAGGAIEISHGAGQGLFYALVSLAQMMTYAQLDPKTYALPREGEISDAPRHGWRGAHLDVSRQFYKLGKVLRYVDIMAWHKMNRFHWHLTDDEGWRLEIKAYPKLTEQASATGMMESILPQLGADAAGQRGFYTQDDARRVIDQAGELGIEVMPEIDLPGHCACVVGAYPELLDTEEELESYHSVQGFGNNALNPAMDLSYTFSEKVLGEVCDLFPFDVVHVGGDEVADDAWMKSPKAEAMMKETKLKGTFELQAHFLRHLQQFLASRGKSIGGWEEMAHGGGVKTENCLLFAWTTVEKTAELAEAGYDVISTPGQAYYLDMAQSSDWCEPGASWAGVTPVTQTYSFEAQNDSPALAKHLKGVQGCVWSEHLTTMERVNHMVFPRLSAIAEAGWTDAEGKDFGRFETIARLMPRL